MGEYIHDNHNGSEDGDKTRPCQPPNGVKFPDTPSDRNSNCGDDAPPDGTSPVVRKRVDTDRDTEDTSTGAKYISAYALSDFYIQRLFQKGSRDDEQPSTELSQPFTAEHERHIRYRMTAWISIPEIALDDCCVWMELVV